MSASSGSSRSRRTAVILDPEDGGTVSLWNIRNYPVGMSHPRSESSAALLWECHILGNCCSCYIIFSDSFESYLIIFGCYETHRRTHLVLHPSRTALVLNSDCRFCTYLSFILFLQPVWWLIFSEFLFPPPPAACGAQVALLRQLDGQYELFTHVEKTIRQNLQQLVMTDVKSETTGTACESLLAGALAMAVCYIHRWAVML